MEKRMFWVQRGWIMLSLAFIAVLFGCDSATTRYTGTYVSVSEEEPSRIETILVLKEPATGVWTANEKEVPIRWSVKGNEILLHTKEGGVIIGKISKDVITLKLPSDKVMTFKKKDVS